MQTTNKISCNIVADVLAAHRVHNVVLSPGSRNTPLILAFSRRKEFRCYVVVDERSAAFIALGMAQQSGESVALVCTSGTALLNYGPAIAEAYYQKLPLIVLSADRPKEWIDQDDSQTIRQYEALASFVKRSYDLPARCGDATATWHINRIVNDAMIEAMSGRSAPVHINVQLDEPLGDVAEYARNTRQIRMVSPSGMLSDSDIECLAKSAKDKKILVIAGFQRHDDRDLSAALERLAKCPNVVILTESIANVSGKQFIAAIDRTLLMLDESEKKEFAPDLLITMGGAIVSRMVKAYLRTYKASEQWYVGVADVTVDCMQSLTLRIQAEAKDFFPAFVRSYIKMGTAYSDYNARWHSLNQKGRERTGEYLRKVGWCDFKALAYVFGYLPGDCRLQLSNGTVVRYAQLFGDSLRVPNNCNRGVSGIDGSTSTALGASLVYGNKTIFVTGDMSLSYDLGGLATQYNHPNFKIIVMCNGGGGIFRFLDSTQQLPELERFLEVRHDIPVENYAKTFDFAYFEAVDIKSLEHIFPMFLEERNKAAILAIKTDGKYNAQVLRRYFFKETKNH